MTLPLKIGRRDVVEILTAYRRASADRHGEDIDSLELAWLIDRVEQRYGVELELEDEQLARMTTVDAAVEVLGGSASGVADG